MGTRLSQGVAYSNVESSSRFNESRVNYGAIVGTDISGNLLVENFATKLRDRVAIINDIIPVDQKIINYFEQYEKVTGLKYSRTNPIVINNTYITELQNNIWDVNNQTNIESKNKRIKELERGYRCYVGV